MISIDTNRPSESQIATWETEKVFGTTNQFVILVPGKNYAEQLSVIEMVEAHGEIDQALGIANVELTLNAQNVYLTEQINYRRFSELLGVDEAVADKIYSVYAYFSKEDSKSGIEEVALYQSNKNIYTASLLQLCDCALDRKSVV